MDLCCSVRIHHGITALLYASVSFAFLRTVKAINKILHMLEFLYFFPSAHRDIKSFPFNKIVPLVVPNFFPYNTFDNKIFLVSPVILRIIDFWLHYNFRFLISLAIYPSLWLLKLLLFTFYFILNLRIVFIFPAHPALLEIFIINKWRKKSLNSVNVRLLILVVDIHFFAADLLQEMLQFLLIILYIPNNLISLSYLFNNLELISNIIVLIRVYLSHPLLSLPNNVLVLRMENTIEMWAHRPAFVAQFHIFIIIKVCLYSLSVIIVLSFDHWFFLH